MRWIALSVVVSAVAACSATNEPAASSASDSLTSPGSFVLAHGPRPARFAPLAPHMTSTAPPPPTGSVHVESCVAGHDCSAQGPYVVTGAGQSPAASQQSESVMAVTTTGTVITTFNDMSGVIQDPTTHNLMGNSSLMGWSVSNDGGTTWTYHSPLRTGGTAWPILWGDPAIVASKTASNTIYMSNLAVNGGDNRVPPTGVDRNTLQNLLSGACIARSTDGGATFGLAQCLTNGHHFYDGASMAAGPGGEAYAAYRDTITNKIDVYKTSTPLGLFTLLPTPFAGTVWDHPRLRVDPTNGDLYVIAMTSDGLRGNMYHGGAWHGEVRITSEGMPSMLSFKTQIIDLGPQYSFDVGDALSVNDCGRPECEYWDSSETVRVSYVTTEGGTARLVVKSMACGAGFFSCYLADEWGTDRAKHPTATGNQFAPLVRAVHDASRTQPLFVLSYLSAALPAVDDTFAIVRTEMPYSTSGDGPLVGTPLIELDRLPVCPLLHKDKNGIVDRYYVGDYDDMQAYGSAGSHQVLGFLRTFTQSAGCNESTNPATVAQRVNAVRFFDVCVPSTCTAGMCGTMGDGCGGTITCGGCGTGDVCKNNKCASSCVPRLHCRIGQCTVIDDDGCGNVLCCGNAIRCCSF